MSSLRKHAKATEYQGRKLHEPSLPLHLALSWIIIRVFPINLDYQYLSDVYSLGFTHKILQLLAREILEVGSQPSSFTSLRDETDKLLHVELVQVVKRNEKRRARGQELEQEYEKAEKGDSWLGELAERFMDVSEGCSVIDSLEKELRERLNFSEDDEPTESPPPMDRHSPLGVFSRNLINILRKLSFDETAHLARQVALWCGVDHSGPSRLVTMWSLDRRSGMEDSLDKRMKSMQEYRAASSSGDYSGALASLRSFYDYQSPSAGRGQHQHALLNIATFHYASNGLESARLAIDEAIRVARTAGDKECLQHCISLSRRLQTETKSVAFTSTETVKIHQTPIPLSRLPEAATPMDELWSIKAALDLGEPVHVAFRRVYAALGLENQLSLPENTGAEDADRPYTKQWPTAQKLDFAAWHAAQSSLWEMMGSRALVELHEDLAEADLDGGVDGRLSVAFARAKRATESGDYEGALSQLVDLSVLQGISMTAYHRWASVVWTLLERRARFNDDHDTLSYIASLSPSSSLSQAGPGGPPRTRPHPSPIPSESDCDSDITSPVALTQSHILSSLRQASSLITSPTPALPHRILPLILSSLTLASSLSLWKIYRFAIVLLAETMLLMEGVPMAGKVVKEVEGVWAQLVKDGDAEGVMRGAGVLGRAWVELSLESGADEEHDKAVEYLLMSQQHAQTLEHRASCLETSSLLAMLAALRANGHFPRSKFQSHANKQVEEELVQRYWKVKEGKALGQEQGLSRGLKGVSDIGEIVKWVGVRVAEGWKESA
ncbi:hypothetical protein IAR50_003297 [Cryptococcus sp. DSM 104548]